MSNASHTRVLAHIRALSLLRLFQHWHTHTHTRIRLRAQYTHIHTQHIRTQTRAVLHGMMYDVWYMVYDV